MRQWRVAELLRRVSDANKLKPSESEPEVENVIRWCVDVMGRA